MLFRYDFLDNVMKISLEIMYLLILSGFGPYTELTYPISTQTIITNGQDYSFYAYQLNTCALYQRFSGHVNPYRNVCFATGEMKLFEIIENDEVKGIIRNILSLV